MKYGKKRSAFLLAAVMMLTGLQMSGVTVKATAATPAVYTAEIKEDQTITAGQTVNLTVEMASDTEKTYNCDYNCIFHIFLPRFKVPREAVCLSVFLFQPL